MVNSPMIYHRKSIELGFINFMGKQLATYKMNFSLIRNERAAGGRGYYQFILHFSSVFGDELLKICNKYHEIIPSLLYIFSFQCQSVNYPNNGNKLKAITARYFNDYVLTFGRARTILHTYAMKMESVSCVPAIIRCYSQQNSSRK